MNRLDRRVRQRYRRMNRLDRPADLRDLLTHGEAGALAAAGADLSDRHLQRWLATPPGLRRRPSLTPTRLYRAQLALVRRYPREMRLLLQLAFMEGGDT
jgi:hypothetical protein